MRIIKLSPKDRDMKDRKMVDKYFTKVLFESNPRGQFLLTKGRISEKGISPGEMIIFSYNVEIVYLALSQSKRLNTIGPDASHYPYYFCVDTPTIVNGKGTLYELEQVMNGIKNIVNTQAWPTKDSAELRKIWVGFMAK